MVSAPFTDNVGNNLGVYSRGSIDFFKVQVQQNGNPVPPDANAFTFTDVRRIEDPDGVDVTADWVTNDLDPNDAGDTYDENHTTYVGGQASPNNIGLFHNGSGAIAQKFKVPASAEITDGVPSRNFRIYWGIRLGGQMLVDGEGEFFEEFNVADYGVLIFESGTVTVSDVRAGIETSLDSDSILELISESVDWSDAHLSICGIDSDTFESLPKAVKQAIILYTRALIFERDASAGQRYSMIQEGSKRVTVAGQTTKDLDTLRGRAEEMLMAYCKRFGKRKRPRVAISNHEVKSGQARR